MQRVLVVVALLMLALPRLGVHAPRFHALEDKMRASTSQFDGGRLDEAQRTIDALPLLQPCLDSAASDTSAGATKAACAPFDEAVD